MRRLRVIRERAVWLVMMLGIAVAACFGGTVTDPYVRVSFGGSGDIPIPPLAGMQDPLFASLAYESLPGEFPAYSQSANASFGSLGAMSTQSGTLASGQARARNSFASMVDRLTITSPDSNEATFLWQPTIQLTGEIDWTVTAGTIDPANAAFTWPVGIAVAQYVRREGETSFTRYSLPDIWPDKGTLNQTIVLDAIPVPANEAFNYQILLAVVSRIRNTNGLVISYSTIDLSQTLKVVGLTVRDSNGEIGFNVEAGSGASYSTNGISEVPEPASAIVTLLGIAGMFAMARARRKLGPGACSLKD
jgi:hypothetical protein